MSAYPYFIESVPCGFPSPADGHQESLDLDEYLIRHPNATFFFACLWRVHDWGWHL